MIDYLDILAELHEQRRPATYLEIGVYRGASLRLARHGTLAVGVDPDPELHAEIASGAIEVATSDEFFAGGRARALFGDRPVDMTFIDGMHLFEYVLRDFIGAESLSAPDSLIVVHDCLPASAASASRERSTLDWSGDVWKLVLCLLDRRPDLRIELLDIPPAGLCLVTDLDPGDRSLQSDLDATVEHYLPLTFADWERRLPEVLERTRAQQATLDLVLRAARADAERLHADGEAARSDLAAVREDLLGAQDRLHRVEADLESTRLDLDESRRSVVEEAARRAEAESALRSATAEATRLASELAAEHARFRAVEASLSWRLTSPLRRAGRLVRSLRGGRPGANEAFPAGAAVRVPPRTALQEEAPADPLLLEAEAAALAYRPIISILVPVYNTPSHYLRIAAASVFAQVYEEWELVLCDDGSTHPDCLRALADLEEVDPRVVVRRRRRNAGISAATNEALHTATGEYVAMLDHDDALHPEALFRVAQALNISPGTDVVYTDQDYVDASGAVTRLFPKPDWSPHLFRGVMYVGHLLVVRRSLALEVGGFDPSFDNVQDFEFMLRVSERTHEIAHVPRTLYHWRSIPGSVALHGDEKAEIATLQTAAVNAHLKRTGVPARASSHPRLAHRLTIEPELAREWPRASVIVFGERCGQAVRDLEEVTDYPDLEFLAVRGDEAEGDASQPGRRRTTIVQTTRGAGLVAAAARAEGHVLVFLDADLDVPSSGWLRELLSDAELTGVACVSPVIVTPECRVASAGLTFDAQGDLHPIMAGQDPDSDGLAGSLSCAREVSIVDGRCFAIARPVLDDLGGLDPAVADARFQAAELSLRARARGRRNLCTPRVRLRETSHASVGNVDYLDRMLLADAHGEVLERGDPLWSAQMRAVLEAGLG